MNNSVIWLLIIIIILLSLCPTGESESDANNKYYQKKFLDDVKPKSRRSDARSTLDLSVMRSILMTVESLVKTKVPWKKKHLSGTTPQIMEAVELRQVGSSGSIFLPPLSVKDTTSSMSSSKTPTTENLTLSFSKGYTLGNFVDGGNIMNRSSKLKGREKHRRVHENLSHVIPWEITTESVSPNKRRLHLPSYQRQSFLNRLQSLKDDKINKTDGLESVIGNTTVLSQQITKRQIYALQYGFAPHVLRSGAVAPKDEQDLDTNSVLKDTTQENVTGINESYQSTRGTHPVTIKPEGEEFVPGMTKSVFITVTSSSLMVAIFVAVITLYYIRRRRIKMAMDPERQRLIPFRAYTGIYYNQTGTCF